MYIPSDILYSVGPFFSLLGGGPSSTRQTDTKNTFPSCSERVSVFILYSGIGALKEEGGAAHGSAIEMDGVGGGGGIRTTVRHFRREAAADKMHTDPSNIYGDSLSLSPISAMYSMFLI
jgi:hypothetical protein